MTILVIGQNGQLARHLRAQMDNQAVFLSRQHLDLADISKIAPTIKQYNPSCIINAGAFTNTSNAEDELGLVYAVNSAATAELALVAKHYQIPFLHISTDYVFDGEKETPYFETDAVNPQNIYGESKALGERLALLAYDQTTIIRTSWIFSEYNNNFVRTIFNAMYEKEQLDIVSDQYGGPTYAGHLASAIIHIAKRQCVGSGERGVFHYQDLKSCTWFDLAKAIKIYLENKGELIKTDNISPVSSLAWPSKINRPKNAILNCDKIYQHYGVRPRYWSDGLEVVLNYLLEQKALNG